eukprot:856847-Prymnesium_polylepis.2
MCPISIGEEHDPPICDAKPVGHTGVYYQYHVARTLDRIGSRTVCDMFETASPREIGADHRRNRGT